MTSRKRPVHRLGDLLPGIASQLGLDEELRAARAISTWRRIVEELVPAAAGATQLLEVRPPILIVSADDAPTGQELRLRSPELLEAFACAPGGQRLRELHVIVRKGRSGDRAKPR
ncbi:MAG: DciA family protein [Chloroflexota bacterium]